MSNFTGTAPAADRTVTLPYSLASSIEGDVTRAHLALTAVNKLLRNGSLDGDEASLAELLSYIEDGLEHCAGKFDDFMHDGTSGAGNA